MSRCLSGLSVCLSVYPHLCLWLIAYDNEAQMAHNSKAFFRAEFCFKGTDS